MTATLVLASTSRYRAELLSRLGLPFDTCAPNVQETIGAGEQAGDAAARLALAKAEAGAAGRPGAVVIGSDQVPALAGAVLRKPGSRDATIEQLSACVGQRVQFHTGVAIIDTRSGETYRTVDVTEVELAELTRPQIERYVAKEQPYDSAGGFRAEGLGIALFNAIRSTDPTGLIGLPLIWVAGTLRQIGLDPLAAAAAPRDAAASR